ncbi:MAG: thiosulfate oxidation carrier protein SoxY [Rhodospirillales bacterium]|nr:thiosulfate oxidation carrier protein SoxY [Rhodospirillales bacterium]MCW8952772.1 thiosulfate oxidation carrier protein SoxY [Rhodospirillales bacterium]MCW9001729.1 thiosulfate oxidation carrier protein SoxY [Rhodospirillales bacterium]
MSDTVSNVAILDRRQVLTAAGAVAVAGFVMGPGFAFAKPEDAAARVKEATGGAAVKEGRITIQLPQIAENGNTVPVTVSVESPMSDADFVKVAHIFVDGNPTPDVASFHFSPMSGKADFSTRIRLAKTQNVIVVAQMSDGSFFTASQQIKVTIGGCGG